MTKAALEVIESWDTALQYWFLSENAKASALLTSVLSAALEAHSSDLEARDALERAYLLTKTADPFDPSAQQEVSRCHAEAHRACERATKAAGRAERSLRALRRIKPIAGTVKILP